MPPTSRQTRNPSTACRWVGWWAGFFLASVLAVASMAAPAHSTRRDVAELSPQKALALGLAGYERYYERRLGSLSKPDQGYVWSTYAHYRRLRNRRLIAQLPPPQRRLMAELRRSLEAWEASYHACAYTENYSASIGGWLVSWSEPRREDLYAQLLLRTHATTRHPSSPLPAVLAKAAQPAESWQRIADAVTSEERDNYRLHRARDLRKQLPILRKELQALARIGPQLPPAAQTALAQYLTRFRTQVDNWERG